MRKKVQNQVRFEGAVSAELSLGIKVWAGKGFLVWKRELGRFCCLGLVSLICLGRGWDGNLIIPALKSCRGF